MPILETLSTSKTGSSKLFAGASAVIDVLSYSVDAIIKKRNPKIAFAHLRKSK